MMRTTSARLSRSLLAQDRSEFARAVATFSAACASPHHAAADAADVAVAYRSLMPVILDQVSQTILPNVTAPHNQFSEGGSNEATPPAPGDLAAAGLLVAAAEASAALPPLRDQACALAARLPAPPQLLDACPDAAEADPVAHAMLWLLAPGEHAGLAAAWPQEALLSLLQHAMASVRWAALRACVLRLPLSGKQAAALGARVLSEADADACWQAWEAHALRLEVRRYHVSAVR